MKQKVRGWHLITAAALLIAIFTAAVWLIKKPSSAVMKIDKYAITQDHLALYENDFRAEVASYFYREYQLDPNAAGFWTTEAGGETPEAILRQKALERLYRDTVERIEASGYGIPADITLAKIRKSLESENAGRQSSPAPPYGPDQYGLREYISRTQMEVRDKLKERLLEGALKPTDGQLKEVYANADPSLFDQGCHAKIGIYMFYGMKAGEYPDGLEAVWNYVEHGLAQGKPPGAIIAEATAQSDIRIEYEEVDYDTADMPRDNQELAWLADETRYLDIGQTTGVLDYGASQGILTVLDKTSYGRAEYEDSVTLVKNLWLDQAYPAYIRERMDSYGYSGIK